MKAKDTLIGLIVVFVWGINFIAIKIGLEDVSPLFLGAIRFFVVAVPAMFFLKKPPISWKKLIALGLSINVGQFSMLFIGMNVGMPAGLASLVLQAQVLFTSLLAVVFLNEKWRTNQKIGLSLALFGICLIGLAKGVSMTPLGFVFTVLAALFWAIGNIIIRNVTKDYDSYPMLSLIVWAGAVAVPPLLVLSFFIEGWDIIVLSVGKFSCTTMFAVLYISYISTLLGYGLWGTLLSRYTAARVSPFALLVPVVGIVSSTLILGERFNGIQIIGGALVMIGLLINLYGDSLRLKSQR